jgi:hypothetical protein
LIQGAPRVSLQGLSGRALFCLWIAGGFTSSFPAALRAQGPAFAKASAGQSTSAVLQSLIKESRRQQLAGDRYWLLLLHERRTWWGACRSDIDDPDFFLSKKGGQDSAVELEATLASFLAPDPANPQDEHPQCRYPARYAWLKERLPFSSQVPEKSCPRFEAWRSQMNPESVSMVFASYYMNNPASMYGHTFLKFNQARHAGDLKLLDYAVNYEAEVNGRNDLFYAVRGLAGGYRGRFSTMPYYMKVQQYNNMESRDLWEYTLRLSPAEVDRMVRHLWELGHTSMAYYFLNKNCSYQLLPVLEVADPSLHLSDRFRFKTVPVDTLRAVCDQPGLVAGIELRSSHVRRMLARRSLLSPREVQLAHDLAIPESFGPTGKNLESLPPDRQALTLDSAYDDFRYRVGFYRDRPSQVFTHEQRLLLLRSQLRTVLPSDPPHENTVFPHESHKTGRIGSGFGFSSRGAFEEFSIRPALHDLEADPSGYVPGSQLEMFNLRLRFDNDRQRVYPEELTLIDLKSLTGWDRWIHSPSWELRTGLSVARDLDRDPENSLYYSLHLGPGLGFESHLWRREMVYGLADMDTGVGGIFDHGYRWGGGGTSGILFEAASFWRIHFQAAFIQYPVGHVGSATKLSLAQSFSISRNVEFRATLERQNTYREALLTLNFYL